MKQADFRKELVKLMPGYKWTVKAFSTEARMEADGIQTSGSNRLSTLRVTRCDLSKKVEYLAKSAGYGKRAPWLHAEKGATLAQALRNLQDHYESMAATYGSHAGDLRKGRAVKQGEQP